MFFILSLLIVNAISCCPTSFDGNFLHVCFDGVSTDLGVYFSLSMLEQPNFPTLACIMHVQPPADKTPIPGFS